MLGGDELGDWAREENPVYLDDDYPFEEDDPFEADDEDGLKLSGHRENRAHQPGPCGRGGLAPLRALMARLKGFKARRIRSPDLPGPMPARARDSNRARIDRTGHAASSRRADSTRWS